MAFWDTTQDVNNHIDWSITTNQTWNLNLIQTWNINVQLQTNNSWYKIQLINWTGSKIPELQPIFVYQMFSLQFLIFWILLILIYIKKILND